MFQRYWNPTLFVFGALNVEESYTLILNNYNFPILKTTAAEESN